MEDSAIASGNHRIRILALHGTQGNNEITKLQLENINIREEEYDIVYIRGTIQEPHGHPDLETMVDGPFFSWIDESSNASKERSILEAVINVNSVLSSELGPFDGIYGFSTGALIAAIVTNTIQDPLLRMKVVTSGDQSSVSLKRIDVSVHGRPVVPDANLFTKKLRSASMLFTTKRTSLDSKNQVRDEETSTACTVTLKFAILACTAFPFSNMDESRRVIGMFKNSFYPGYKCDFPSFHIIATEDGNKTKSEDWAMVFSEPRLMYISSAHGIGRAQRKDHELLDSLSQFIAHKGNPRSKIFRPKFKPVSKVSSISVMPQKQVALVRLDESRLVGGGLTGRDNVRTTIGSLLKAQPRDKPFLCNARANAGIFTSYGQLSDFILGDGNLSNLGVQQNEVVAYGCPAGATALATVAFLSIASFAIAAPIAPNTSKADTLDTLEQFNAKFLIIFEGVECPEVNAAFQQYSSQGKAKIIRAFVQYTNPGIFAYTKRSPSHDGTQNKFTNTAIRLCRVSSEHSRSNGTCLLLRTSGTTSRPKVVQLTQRDLIRNGGILASSLGLDDNDVCYSVMPLYHIGGLSASILSTLVSGGTVCCETSQFNPERMIDALATSNPKPTWYSAVPTIHNATVDFIKTIEKSVPSSPKKTWRSNRNANKHAGYGISDGIWLPADKDGREGHSLRFIRSGAAELSSADALALSQTYGGIPCIPTYSMSEQMPITQPPAGKYDMIHEKPGSVGVAIAGSIAIVNGCLRPLRHGKVGELAISGSTVMTKYLENPEADRKSFFYLPLDIVGSPEEMMGRYFLTGDTGQMDKEGFITLKGRTKELIKKGGEQISPFEVEDVLKKHHWVHNAICFSVPSKFYGEAVGAALVLSNTGPTDIDLDEIISEMRTLMKKCKFDPLKWPMRWKIVMDEDLPKTKTQKYIRIGLSKILGLDEDAAMISMPSLVESSEKKASIDYKVLSGLRFVLACYVMFMHIGSHDSWGVLSNLRLSPWHVHTFFSLAGYIMASPMSPKIQHKFKYVRARIGSIYSLYFLAVLFGLGNLLVSCRPSTFREDFSWHSKPDDLFSSTESESGQRSDLFCEGTPLFPRSYWGSLIFTLLSYFSGLTVTPFWVLNWWLGYYLWFFSIYNQCLMIYPATYNFLHARRKQGRFLVKLVIALVLASVAIVVTMWFVTRYTNDDDENDRTGSDEWLHHAIVLGFYLFSPFWMIYFVIGITLAFVYDAYRPKETHHAKRYGYIADICTVTILALSIVQVSQGGVDETRNYFFRPSEANNSYLDDASTNRLWDTVYGRLFCPITSLWIYTLSTGEGVTAKFLRNEILVSTLAPNSYGCFLFHQMVGQWYFAATRNGLWWNWWSYRKTMYWFSPKPIPVEWFEYPYIVGLVILFTRFITNHVEPHVSRFFVGIGTGINDSHIGEGNDEIRSSSELMLAVVIILTGVEATMNNTSEECGLGSIGMPIVVSTLNKMLAKDRVDATVNVSEMIQARTIADMVAVIDTAKSRASDSGI